MSFLQRWLHATRRPSDETVVTVEDLEAAEDVDGAEVLEFLGKELRRNYVSRDELAQYMDTLGVDAVANHLRTTKFPSDKSVRSGEFGEAVAGTVFRVGRRYCMPILKLRYKQGRNRPVFGADILAFRLRSDPPVVAVPEVKTRPGQRDLNIGVTANGGLADIIQRLDESITFVVARLSERGQASLAARVAKLLTADRVIERHIVLVNESSRWDERILQRLRAAAQAAVDVTVLRLADLAKLIDESYLAAEKDATRDQ